MSRLNSAGCKLTQTLYNAHLYHDWSGGTIVHIYIYTYICACDFISCIYCVSVILLAPVGALSLDMGSEGITFHTILLAAVGLLTLVMGSGVITFPVILLAPVGIFTLDMGSGVIAFPIHFVGSSRGS